MSGNFYSRLRDYYSNVAKVLRGEADACSVFPNPVDAGGERERIYINFLQQHVPTKCNVFLGGFLFHEDGTESKQLDVIITTDTVARFDFQNKDGGGKSFAPVNGTIGVASIKSTLNKKQLFDALDGIASIPQMNSNDIKPSLINIRPRDYNEWPYKIIYANKGIRGETLLNHINNYYSEHLDVPKVRRPNIIHVSGKYAIIRLMEGRSAEHISRDPNRQINEIGKFVIINIEPDLQAIMTILNELNIMSSQSKFMIFSYKYIAENIKKEIVDRRKDSFHLA